MTALPVFVSDATAREVLDWKEMIDALREAHAADLHPHAAPPRTVARGTDGVWMRALTAVPAGPLIGTKFFTLSKTRTVTYVIALFERETARLVAFVDANTVTAMRTAATSAVAVDAMAPKRKLALGVLGSGHEARAHVRAIAAVRPVGAVAVYSPTPSNRAAFAELFAKELGVPCRAADAPDKALAGADLVVAATSAGRDAPNTKGEWLSKGQTVVSIGSTLPEQWELDPAAIAKADLIVCDSPEEVTHGTGDFIGARKAGVAFDDKVFSLPDLVRGRLADRLAKAAIPMFKSAGTGLQDVVVASLAWRKAVARGMANELPMELSLKGGERARAAAAKAAAG